MIFGKLKDIAIAILSLLSAIFAVLFLWKSGRYRLLEEEKETLEEESREQKEVIDQIQEDVKLVEELRQKVEKADKEALEEVKKIEEASDDELLDRLNRMHD